MKRIFFVTNYKNIIPQKLHETIGLDLDKLKDFLKEGFICCTISLDDLASKLLNNDEDINGDYFFFTSSQIQNYKSTILDVAYDVQCRGGILLPKYDLYKSHDNKYYQELYKSRNNVKTPHAQLLSTSNSPIKPVVPVVIKASQGFGSKGVQLVKESGEVSKSVSSLMSPYYLPLNSVDETLRRTVKYFYKYKGLYPKKIGQVVLQEFIPNLEFDWKVLVFGKSVFVLKRYVRDNDFRASGSGKFDYECSPSDELIKFAEKTRNQLDTPFVSLDIAESSNSEFSVIEFQSVHFGLATMINAKRVFTVESGGQVNCNPVDNVCVEEYFSKSLASYIYEKY